jgi:hypothetical protein
MQKNHQNALILAERILEEADEGARSSEKRRRIVLKWTIWAADFQFNETDAAPIAIIALSLGDSKLMLQCFQSKRATAASIV